MSSQKQLPRIMLVMLFPKGTSQHTIDMEMSEAQSLIGTFGAHLVVKKIQFRGSPNRHTFFGAGKIEEIVSSCSPLDIDIVVINNILKPGQMYHIKEKIEAQRFEDKHIRLSTQVWDRVDLILKIFEKHAKTKEARLQIELAAIKHMGPRIFGMGMDLSRQGGGVGTRGAGETNTSMMKTHLSKMEKQIKDNIEKCQKVRATQRENRIKKGIKQWAIVGYTNAGKSSLINVLTKKGSYAANELFASLDTRTAGLYLPDCEQSIVLTDTIGFIKDLPPQLIQAFKSTLDETVHADGLIHVVDLSNPNFLDHIKTVESILKDIKVREGIPQIYAFNKVDRYSEDALEKDGPLGQLFEMFKDKSPIGISVKGKKNLNELKSLIAKKLTEINGN